MDAVAFYIGDAREPDLLECPFCGARPKIRYIGNAHTKKRAVHIACSTFGCTVEMRVGAIVHNHLWCLTHAAFNWNRRTTPTVVKNGDMS